MKTNELGLPFEYQQYPEFFDATCINDDTDTHNAVIAQLLSEYKAQQVLDMTCGTGSQVFFLHNQGFEVTGADFSPALIAQAQAKASAHNLPLTFLHGDMRTLYAGKYDAVITIFNAIGHLSKDDFALTLQNISHNLKPGGIYVFDIMNTEALTDNVIMNLAWNIHKTVGTTRLHHMQCNTLDRTNGILTAHEYTMIQRSPEHVERYANVFSLQLYTAPELTQMLHDAGFINIAFYTFDESPFDQQKSIEMVVVAALPTKQ